MNIYHKELFETQNYHPKFSVPFILFLLTLEAPSTRLETSHTLSQFHTSTHIILCQVFSKADVWFSPDGETYEEEPLSYSYIPDIVLENARNVSIGLHERRGKLLKIHLYFAARWIMLSEVTFEGSEYHSPQILYRSSFRKWPLRNVLIDPSG